MSEFLSFLLQYCFLSEEPKILYYNIIFTMMLHGLSDVHKRESCYDTVFKENIVVECTVP